MWRDRPGVSLPAVRAASLIAAVLALAVTVAPAPSAAAKGVPTQKGAPWPSMRHDRFNTGRSPIRAHFHPGDRPWVFVTGKGVFSTPVVGPRETVYAGSADTRFYALRDGRARWRFKTGGIIDSAAVLGRGGTVTFGSGDERLYRLRTGDGRVVWRYRATRKPAQGQLVNWWEGNVTMGPGGILYAGNTGGAEYSLNPNGRLRWLHPTGNSVWSNAAIARDGTVFFGSLDLNIYAVDSRGRERWRRPTGGFVTSSPAIGPGGTVYIGSFDGAIHALDPNTGRDRWSYATDDHVYSSPTLGEKSVYIASADGSVYAFDLRGNLRWRYDTGDTVRSSPVLGRAPRGGGRILYVGSANGSLYALDASTGRRRWSFDTTPRDPILRDRNDLNSSPALGRRGVYIGGEHGRVVFVPYDWCLRARRDARCNRNPGEPFGGSLDRMAYVTPGGSTRLSGPAGPLPAATALTTRLLVRQLGETVDASLVPPTRVTADPPFDFTAQPSGDGHLPAHDPDRVPAAGARVHPARRGRLGRRRCAPAPSADTIRFRTAKVRHRGAPLRAGRRLLGSAGWPSRCRRSCRASTRSASTRTTWSSAHCDVSPPDANGEGSLLLWAVSTKRGRGGATTRIAAAPSPSRSRAATATTRCCSRSAASA